MEKGEWVKIATFLLNAAIALVVYNVSTSISSLKELLNTKIDHMEKRFDRHESHHADK
jgi:hypothetical protein